MHKMVFLLLVCLNPETVPVCMYVCIYENMRVYMYAFCLLLVCLNPEIVPVCMYVCVCIYMIYISRVKNSRCTYIEAYIHTYACMHAHTSFIFSKGPTYTWSKPAYRPLGIHTYIHTHIDIHTYTHLIYIQQRPDAHLIHTRIQNSRYASPSTSGRLPEAPHVVDLNFKRHLTSRKNYI